MTTDIYIVLCKQSVMKVSHYKLPEFHLWPYKYQHLHQFACFPFSLGLWMFLNVSFSLIQFRVCAVVNQIFPFLHCFWNLFISRVTIKNRPDIDLQTNAALVLKLRSTSVTELPSVPSAEPKTWTHIWVLKTLYLCNTPSRVRTVPTRI